MRNLKVSAKLLAAVGTLFVMMVIISIMSIYGMSQINNGNDTLAEKSLVNVEYVWEIRRNVVSQQRYLLAALAENDTADIINYCNEMDEDVANTKEILAAYKNNARIDTSIITTLESKLNSMATVRDTISTLVKMNDETANAQAFDAFENQFMPLQDEVANLLVEITEMQDELVEEEVDNCTIVYRSMLIMSLILIAVAFVLAGTMLKMVTAAILNPLNEINAAADALAKGDFNAAINYESRDELGQTCTSIKTAFGTMKNIIADLGLVLDKLSNGDLTAKLSQNYPGELAAIEDSVKAMAKTLNTSMQAINDAAGQIDTGASQVSSGSQALAQGATEQASAVQELAATTNEINAVLEKANEDAMSASNAAIESGKTADQCNQQMQQLVQAMDDINSSTEQVNKIIKEIDDIAFQTNILALNAAVEAARAGSAGKGFAVVADEVRNLAAKSAESAKNTASLIEACMVAVERGAGLVTVTAKQMEQVSDDSNEMAKVVKDIALSAQRSTESVRQVTTGLDQISSVVQTNSATAEESAAASEELSGQAAVLNGLVKRFKLDNSAASYAAYAPTEDYSAPAAPAAEPESFGGSKY